MNEGIRLESSDGRIIKRIYERSVYSLAFRTRINGTSAKQIKDVKGHVTTEGEAVVWAVEMSLTKFYIDKTVHEFTQERKMAMHTWIPCPVVAVIVDKSNVRPPDNSNSSTIMCLTEGGPTKLLLGNEEKNKKEKGQATLQTQVKDTSI
ncbi:hypothetical protein C5167_025269 [Papaver somniferum]|uniref:Uncharacterized protein n=1 Tax=Papaver somniferum TaxID=3469 RepID=A0A4Y7JSI8_PAPSO|nr:hypothetical protein C5167_025269 [Papaver somniferum]